MLCAHSISKWQTTNQTCIVQLSHSQPICVKFCLRLGQLSTETNQRNNPKWLRQLLEWSNEWNPGETLAVILQPLLGIQWKPSTGRTSESTEYLVGCSQRKLVSNSLRMKRSESSMDSPEIFENLYYSIFMSHAGVVSFYKTWEDLSQPTVLCRFGFLWPFSKLKLLLKKKKPIRQNGIKENTK